MHPTGSTSDLSAIPILAISARLATIRFFESRVEINQKEQIRKVLLVAIHRNPIALRGCVQPGAAVDQLFVRDRGTLDWDFELRPRYPFQ
jgi:hypothetical protein